MIGRSVWVDSKSQRKRNIGRITRNYYNLSYEKKIEIFFTPTKPPEIFFILEESEVMEFQLSRLEKEMENMKEEFQKELDALKYDLHSIKEEILNEIRVHHTLNSSTEEEDKENKNVESQSLT